MRTHLLRALWCAHCGSSSDPGVSLPSFLLALWGFSCSVPSYILLSVAPALIHSTFFHFICLISHISGFSSSSERLACISFTWNSLYPPPFFFDSFFVPSCHVCIRQCCLKQPLYSYPSLLQIPAPRHFLRPYFLSCFGQVNADVPRYWLSAAIYCQHSAKLSSLTAGSGAARVICGVSLGRHKDNRNINFIAFSAYTPMYLRRLATSCWPSEQSKKIRARGNWTQQ